MALYAYNGYLASANPADFGGLDNSFVPGTKTKLAPGLRKGDVATVLFYVAEQLHLRVQPIDKTADDWGYNFRPNTNNKSQISVHGAGACFDYNATQHPNGRKDTWTAAQKAEILRILAEVFGTVRCLFGYDEMHFEVCKDEKAIAEAARHVELLRAGTAPVVPKTSAGKPILKAGSTGDAVKVLQGRLKKGYPAYAGSLTVDGDFGAKTEAAVKEFQRRSKLTADGIVGQATWKALGL